ncbi:CASP-like protein 1F2 [Pistacia vera]|uniref:CASP-like protein 1F2 n=1 Tax=Pistacia vera TaxID=55513 RepID=UPI0012630090|nr:CASP-like protein 1F2 [Pistacia vera]XP_031252186.1 CASP-like protein 1F2 [Pistacia vera]XP_031265797.1 CASP-like protein 1F2 [Pistacia vera]XP_031265798.1 CASP-like protein 1F2 [Pistacia vera]
MASEIAVKSSTRRSFFMAQVMLRILAIAFTLAAISVMLTSTESVMLFGIKLVATYSDSSAMRFFLGANITACIFSFLSLIFVCVISRSESQLNKCFYLFLHDMVIMVLLISGCAAASAIGYLSKYGEEKIGWTAVCDSVSKFCNRVMISLVLSYLGFFSYMALAIMAAKKFMSTASER